jgi:hypothetical protein
MKASPLEQSVQGDERASVAATECADAMNGALKVGDALPRRLSATDMMRIFGIGQARFYVLLKAGKFDRFEQLPRIGRRSWSGVLVQRWLDGEPDASRFVIGRKKSA